MRFWSKVNVPELAGCWLWAGAIDRYGYGFFGDKTLGRVRVRKAHRMAYEFIKGEIPDGLVLDHLCENRACVNPDHLAPVTVRENTLRSDRALAAINARKTACAHGHPFDSENTGRDPRDGSRVCLTCRGGHR